MSFNSATTREELKLLLSRREKKIMVASGRVPAAVLLLVYYREGQHYILFTRRTNYVRYHKGQISFPGGSFQPEDGTLLNTALRECTEEIGLEADCVEVLGELDDVETQTSNYVVSPFVGFIPWPCRFKLEELEAEELIEVPVTALLDHSNPHLELMEGEREPSLTYHYNGEVIWGATAEILYQFLEVFTRLSTTSGEGPPYQFPS